MAVVMPDADTWNTPPRPAWSLEWLDLRRVDLEVMFGYSRSYAALLYRFS